MGDPALWSCNAVSDWLKENGFQKYCQLLCDEHQIDGQSLLSLTEDDLKQSPIEIHVMGDVKRLSNLIKTLQSKQSSFSSRQKNGTINHNGLATLHADTVLQIVGKEHSGSGVLDNELNRFIHKQQLAKLIPPEKWKVFVGVLYLLFGLFCTCFAIVTVQSKAPDQQIYPPLPDLFLNHFPQISWAYKVSDGVLLSLMLTWIIVVVLHKHRWVLMRRTFSLMGTMYLLRCICILITHLPVPETDVRCDRKNYTTFWGKAERAGQIFFGGGLKVSGLRTCGDYMFSGHTVTMTMLNFLITEYTPKRLCWLHITSWIANLFGMFFILAGHGHYSIDVFVAFVFTSRLFCYYHTLANNVNLMSRDTKRTKIWFPVFSYFECNSTGVIPHEYEWPLPSWTKLKNYLRGYELVSLKDKS